LRQQDRKLAEALLNECNSDGWTPMHVASNEGHVELIEVFAEFGGNLDCRSKNLRTPLHVACIRGNFGVIKALIQKEVDINAQDLDGYTPCHFCSEYGHIDCLRLLLRQHPQLIIKNKDNLSPLDVAVNKEVCQVSCPLYYLFLLDLYRLHKQRERDLGESAGIPYRLYFQR